MGPARREDRGHEPGPEGGVSVIGMLLVLVVLAAVLAWVVGWPGFLNTAASDVGTTVVGLVEGSAQARALRQMQDVAAANSRMRMEVGRFAESIAELARHYPGVPEKDPWGRAWDYSSTRTTWRLRSFGADGTPGPAPPSPWRGGHEDADLVMVTGALAQAPER